MTTTPQPPTEIKGSKIVRCTKCHKPIWIEIELLAEMCFMCRYIEIDKIEKSNQPPTEARALTESDVVQTIDGRLGMVSQYAGDNRYCVLFHGRPSFEFVEGKDIVEVYKNHRTTPTAREVLEELLAYISDDFNGVSHGGLRLILVDRLKQIIAKQLEKVVLGKGGE